VRFTVLGHGALSVEAAGARLLVDPWLTGSCYWRSWWHYPPTEVRAEDLAPDFVYLSHHHFDHFHYPSMRRLARTATVLVPRFGVDVMPGEVRSLGFGDVRELAHGEIVELRPGLRVVSFQYGFDDSALLVEADGVVLADLNDCKVRGRALAQVRRAFGPPTFLLKSHSWAQGYPVCYEADDPADLELVSRDSYLADFLHLTRALRPRYAVPFASMVCFLHPQSEHVNDSVVTPREVAAAAEQAPVPGSEVVMLAPGEGWDSEGGFARGDVDWYDPAVRAATLARRRQEVAPIVEAATAEEHARVLDWPTFHSYFLAMARALPPGVARVLVPRPVTFHVASDAETPAWTVDLRHRRVTRSAAPPASSASVITIDDGVLADAIDKRLVNLIHISLRFRDHVRAGGAGDDLTFWGLVAIVELGYLPLRLRALPRLAAVAWARWREVGEVVGRRLIGRGSFGERMTGGLISSSSEASGAR
jgi:UDP-MurNAc hydroxylase